jgi:hypothetical protein
MSRPRRAVAASNPTLVASVTKPRYGTLGTASRENGGTGPGPPKNIGTDLMLLETEQREASPTLAKGYKRQDAHHMSNLHHF